MTNTVTDAMVEVANNAYAISEWNEGRPKRGLDFESMRIAIHAALSVMPPAGEAIAGINSLVSREETKEAILRVAEIIPNSPTYGSLYRAGTGRDEELLDAIQIILQNERSAAPAPPAQPLQDVRGVLEALKSVRRQLLVMHGDPRKYGDEKVRHWPQQASILDAIDAALSPVPQPEEGK